MKATCLDSVCRWWQQDDVSFSLVKLEKGTAWHLRWLRRLFLTVTEPTQSHKLAGGITPGQSESYTKFAFITYFISTMFCNSQEVEKWYVFFWGQILRPRSSCTGSCRPTQHVLCSLRLLFEFPWDQGEFTSFKMYLEYRIVIIKLLLPLDKSPAWTRTTQAVVLRPAVKASPMYLLEIRNANSHGPYPEPPESESLWMEPRKLKLPMWEVGQANTQTLSTLKFENH